MGTFGNMGRYFGKTGIHCVGIGIRHHRPGGLAQCRTDRAEQTGRGVALIGRLARSCALARPLPYPAVLLGDVPLIVEIGSGRRCQDHG